MGFKGLFLCRSDGKTQTLLDFSLHGEEGKKPDKPQRLTVNQRSKRFSKERAGMEKVTKRIDEYKESKLSRTIQMVKQAIQQGIRFDYLLVYSWFTCADLVWFISGRHIKCHLLGMIKMENTKYETSLGHLKAAAIVEKLTKSKKVNYSRHLNCYHCQAEAVFAEKKVKLFFCKRGRKGNWHGILTTNLSLEFMEAYKIYSMRWAIKVVFFEGKGLLRLGKCQTRNFSAQIASVSLTMIQYNILSVIKRFEAYETIGGLFNQATKGAMELSVTDKIWEIILNVVTLIAGLFSAYEEEIIKVVINNNGKWRCMMNIYNYRNVG